MAFLYMYSVPDGESGECFQIAGRAEFPGDTQYVAARVSLGNETGTRMFGSLPRSSAIELSAIAPSSLEGPKRTPRARMRLFVAHIQSPSISMRNQ